MFRIVESMIAKWVSLIVIAVSSLLLLTNLGKNVLANWDEAWYADASRFMFRNDHFLTPIWNNQYFFDKPPLQYWLTQPFLWIFGEKELAYRMPSAIAGVVLTLLVYQWGKSRNGISGGLIAAFVLLSFPHFLDRSRSGNFDALFTLWTTLSLYLFAVKKKPFLGGIILGLSWFTKGIFSGFFPIVVVALFLIYDVLRFQSSRFFLSAFRFTLIALLIYTPWHFLELTRFEHLIHASYFASFDQGTFGSWDWMEIADRVNLRYAVFLWTFLRWWFPIALIAVGWSLWRMMRSNANLLASLSLRRSGRIHANVANSYRENLVFSFLPLITFGTIFLTLSAAREKNDWYIMPTYPFIALMISDFFHHMFQQRKVFLIIAVLFISISNLWSHWLQAFPPNSHLVEKEVAEFVKSHTMSDDLIVTAEYEFPTLRYYSEREIRTVARQPDFQGKYWWIWDNVDIETALRHGRAIVVITRPGTEWPVDVWGYHRETTGEINGRVISRLVMN